MTGVIIAMLVVVLVKLSTIQDDIDKIKDKLNANDDENNIN